LYQLYKYDLTSKVNLLKIKLDHKNIKLTDRKLSLVNLFRSNRFLIDLYWLLNTKGNCWVYNVYDGEKGIHHSYVTGKCYKYPFMNSKDIQIGNSFTAKEYRGYGIYPYVIQHIVNKYLAENPNRQIYMLVEDSNNASQRGIKKIGFIKADNLEVKRILGLIKVYTIKTSIT
jgi:hypothetical protein